uniref:NAC domain-containing protein n=1 Tax=Quercus lobata TaxID=97700 RepID=A0A7N2M2V9_QUELO
MMIWLPCGSKFNPEDDQLINLYLMKKVRGQSLGLLHDAMKYSGSVYGSNGNPPLPPWEYCTHDKALLDYEKYYFFTMLNRVGGESRVARTVGNYGAWHVSSTNEVYDPKTQKLIGMKKLLNFKVYEKDGMSKTEWLMHEFSLAGDSLEGADPELCSKLVLCVIQNTEKKGFDHKGMKCNFRHCFSCQNQQQPLQTMWKTRNQAIEHQSPVPNNNFTIPSETGTRIGTSSGTYQSKVNTSYNHTASAATGAETGIGTSSGTYVEVGNSCTNQFFNSEATRPTKKICRLHQDMGIGMSMPSLPLGSGFELGNQALQDSYQSSLSNTTNMGAFYMDYNFPQEINIDMPTLPLGSGFEFGNQAHQDSYQSFLWNPTNMGALYTDGNFDQEIGMDMPSLQLGSGFHLGNQPIQDAYHSSLPNPKNMGYSYSKEDWSKKTCCLPPIPPNIGQSSGFGGFFL